MRRYECLVILDPELADEEVKNFSERFDQLIKTSNGETIKLEDWGMKKLAYLVKKRDKGRYILFDFVGLPPLMAEMERQFKIAEEVLKYLTVKVDENIDLEAFKAAAAEEAIAPSEPAPSEIAASSDVITEAETASQPSTGAEDADTPLKTEAETVKNIEEEMVNE